MNQPNSGSATLPRGFRYPSYDAPKTPEPFSQNEAAQIPSPPRPRFRIKRRNVSSQPSAATQQFLASVAAADVPIPSIEQPEAEPRDLDMIGSNTFPGRHQDQNRDLLSPHPIGRAFSPPKTPAPGYVPFLSPSRYPNWSIDSAISSSVESTPDYESSRPSTSRSTQTSASLFSHFSYVSDDYCESLEMDGKENFTLSAQYAGGPEAAVEGKAKLRRAPWTKAMSEHLWATLELYLQDPKVTPFRMGKNFIPPQGVCIRVAREAKRSWKGSKALAKATNPSDGNKSGSSTPTAESSSAFIQWPHSCGATRAHLRKLCKLKASAARNSRFMSRSPTPFSQAHVRHLGGRSNPARPTSSVFTTQDMSKSLVLSTADSMQPRGPLAQLTGSAIPIPFPSIGQNDPFAPSQAFSTFEGEPSFSERTRLGSPFTARSYGPSSSTSLAAALGLGNTIPRRQTHTVGPRRTLQSPVRLSRSGTQKRRNTQSSEPRKRPSIGSDLWVDPGASSSAAPRVEVVAPAPEFSSTISNRYDELFIPRVPVEPSLICSASMPDVGSSQLMAPQLPPPRLGSPFSGTNSSFSFPNRLHRNQPMSVDLGMLGRPFATIQQATEPSTPAPARTSLAGRLAYIDQRLKELRNRDARRRSESPL